MAEAQAKQAKALLEAARSGDDVKLRELLAGGVPADTQDERGQSALYLAAAFGHLDATKTLLDAGADLRAAHAPDGGSALQSAVFGERSELVRLLIERGADVNAPDEDGFTPLMAAAYTGTVECARLLLDAGADTNARGKFAIVRKELTALEWAKRERKKAVAQLLAEAAGSPTSAAEPAEVELKRFAENAATPAFQVALEKLRTLCSKPPVANKKIKGSYRARLKPLKALAAAYGINASNEGAVFRRVFFGDFQALGFLLVLAEPRGPGEPATVALYPTDDKYAVVLACSTDGANYGHSTRDIIAWLRELEKDHPFLLTSCGRDFVAGEFAAPVQDAAALAQHMVKFCPDLIDGETIKSPKDVAQALAADQGFFFWWD